MHDSNLENVEHQSHKKDENKNQTPYLRVVESDQIYHLYVSGRFLDLVGDLITAAVLSYIVKWTPYSTDPEGWIYFSYTSENPNTQTICGDLRISRGDARKAILNLQNADFIKAEARWVAGTCVKRMHVQINRGHPEIDAELAEQEKRYLNNKRRKSKTDFRQSKPDFERSESNSTKSNSDFDLHRNKISNIHSTEIERGITDSDIDLVLEWLRTEFDPKRTRSDAIAYVEKRLVDGYPNPGLAERLSELRLNAQKQSSSTSSSEQSQAIQERRDLYKEIMGGEA